MGRTAIDMDPVPGIKGNDLSQFENPATEVVLLPESAKSGTLIQPFVAGH